MGSPTRDARNDAARQLLDYGFATYSIYENAGGEAGRVQVVGGISDSCGAEYPSVTALLQKGKHKNVQTEILLDEKVSAPIKKGERVGTVRYILGGEVLAELDIKSTEDVPKISFFELLRRMLGIYCLN
jgi:D-alanyl-D-alanine carboxypeptidase (penicillin-binding protein 5/6)